MEYAWGEAMQSIRKNRVNGLGFWVLLMACVGQVRCFEKNDLSEIQDALAENSQPGFTQAVLENVSPMVEPIVQPAQKQKGFLTRKKLLLLGLVPLLMMWARTVAMHGLNPGRFLDDFIQLMALGCTAGALINFFISYGSICTNLALYLKLLGHKLAGKETEYIKISKELQGMKCVFLKSLASALGFGVMSYWLFKLNENLRNRQRSQRIYEDAMAAINSELYSNSPEHRGVALRGLAYLEADRSDVLMLSTMGSDQARAEQSRHRDWVAARRLDIEKQELISNQLTQGLIANTVIRRRAIDGQRDLLLYHDEFNGTASSHRLRQILDQLLVVATDCGQVMQSALDNSLTDAQKSSIMQVQANLIRRLPQVIVNVWQQEDAAGFVVNAIAIGMQVVIVEYLRPLQEELQVMLPGDLLTRVLQQASPLLQNNMIQLEDAKNVLDIVVHPIDLQNLPPQEEWSDNLLAWHLMHCLKAGPRSIWSQRFNHGAYREEALEYRAIAKHYRRLIQIYTLWKRRTENSTSRFQAIPEGPFMQYILPSL